ncbi:Scr1 family TA system antitoxin-like transcriptional regulator [Actinokineospora sp. G85]|uniref:Scr1 family TA system antitoxin-like transcriptional regulator n=1 Tax=Actinokineospora sp. G85 TaxID=3406626 RepID=UPI003C72BB04
MILARSLDAQRRRLGISTRDLAKAVHMSTAMANRVMTGRRVPTPVEIGGLCAVLKVPALRRPILYDLARHAGETNWLLGSGEVPGVVGEISVLATRSVAFDPVLVPGAVRTAEYTEAVTGVPVIGQSASLPSGAARTVVVSERSLVHDGVPGSVMAAQLRALLDCADEWVVVRAEPAPPQACTVFWFAHFPPVVHARLHGADLVLEEPAMVSGYQDLCARLLDSAESGEDSRKLVRDRLAGLGQFDGVR